MIFRLPRHCDESGKTHESKCETTSGELCNRCALHSLVSFVKLKALPDSGKITSYFFFSSLIQRTERESSLTAVDTPSDE